MSYNKGPDGPPPAYDQEGGNPSYPPPQLHIPLPIPATAWLNPVMPHGQPAPGYSQGNTTVVFTQPGVVLHSARLRKAPVQMICPQCRAQIVTSAGYQTGSLTRCVACIICLVGCWAGCCLIPFCVDDCKDVIHSCPNCKCQIGAYRIQLKH